MNRARLVVAVTGAPRSCALENGGGFAQGGSPALQWQISFLEDRIDSH